MDYQSILNILQTTAFQLFSETGGGLFHYGIKETQQQQVNEQTPQILVDPFNDVLNTDKANSTVRVVIGFLDLDTAGSSALEQQQTQFRMEKLSNQYFSILADIDEFSELTINRNFIHHFTHTQLTGIVCDFQITVPAELC